MYLNKLLKDVPIDTTKQLEIHDFGSQQMIVYDQNDLVMRQSLKRYPRFLVDCDDLLTDSHMTRYLMGKTVLTATQLKNAQDLLAKKDGMPGKMKQMMIGSHRVVTSSIGINLVKHWQNLIDPRFYHDTQNHRTCMFQSNDTSSEQIQKCTDAYFAEKIGIETLFWRVVRCKDNSLKTYAELRQKDGTILKAAINVKHYSGIQNKGYMLLLWFKNEWRQHRLMLDQSYPKNDEEEEPKPKAKQPKPKAKQAPKAKPKERAKNQPSIVQAFWKQWEKQ